MQADILKDLTHNSQQKLQNMFSETMYSTSSLFCTMAYMLSITNYEVMNKTHYFQAGIL